MSAIGAMAVGAMLLLGLPDGANAQAEERPWVLEGRGGISVPAGDLADVFDVGSSFGAGVGYRVHPRGTLRVDGDVGILSGADDLATGVFSALSPSEIEAFDTASEIPIVVGLKARF